MSETSPTNGNGKAVLHTLASSGNQWVQLGTLALVGLTGIGNFIQGERLNSAQIEDRERAVRQISQMYAKIEDFETRDIESARTHTEQLKNQAELLENQHTLLKYVREGQIQFMQRQQRQMSNPPEF